LDLVDNLFLQRVLSPLAIEDFLDQHWEAGPLHIGRADSNHFSDLLDTPQLEKLFSTQLLSFPQVQLTQSDRPVTPPDYCDDSNRVVPIRAMAQHAQGATLVLSHAQNLLAGLARLCRDTEAAMRMPSQANVYLSPAGRQGFNPHYDTHDVFVLQVSGCKTFNFYSGGAQLPFEHQKHDPEQSRCGTKDSEINMQPGDCLYIPRGFVHDAQAQGDASSLHITLGVFPVTVSELLQQAIGLAAERDPDLRRAVPHDAWPVGHSNHTTTVSRWAANLPGNLLGAENIQRALAELQDKLAIEAKQDCTGLLTAAQASVATSDSIIPTANIDLQRVDNTVTLRAQGQILELAEPLASAVEELCIGGKTALRSLTGLNDEQRVALATQLLMCGMFRRES